MKGGNHIRLEEVPEVTQCHLLERARKRVSGAVDEDVHAPVVGVDLLDKSGDRGLIGDIESAGLQSPRPQGIESFRVTAGREHHIIAGLQPVSGGLTDAARRSGDQSNRLGSLGLHWITAPCKLRRYTRMPA